MAGGVRLGKPGEERVSGAERDALPSQVVAVGGADCALGIASLGEALLSVGAAGVVAGVLLLVFDQSGGNQAGGSLHRTPP